MNSIRKLPSIGTKSFDHSKITNSDEENISKSIFYACTVCEGPLVPVSSCTFCKRTSLRKCTKCDKIKDMAFHESCKILVSFGWVIAQKHVKDFEI